MRKRRDDGDAIAVGIEDAPLFLTLATEAALLPQLMLKNACELTVGITIPPLKLNVAVPRPPLMLRPVVSVPPLRLKVPKAWRFQRRNWRG